MKISDGYGFGKDAIGLGKDGWDLNYPEFPEGCDL